MNASVIHSIRILIQFFPLLKVNTFFWHRLYMYMWVYLYSKRTTDDMNKINRFWSTLDENYRLVHHWNTSSAKGFHTLLAKRNWKICNTAHFYTRLLYIIMLKLTVSHSIDWIFLVSTVIEADNSWTSLFQILSFIFSFNFQNSPNYYRRVYLESKRSKIWTQVYCTSNI